LLRFVLAGVAVAAVVSGCSDDPPATSPSSADGAALLKDSATAAKEIKSAHFELTVDGTIPNLSVHSAEGDLTTEGGPSGGAKGKVNMDLFGQLFEGEFVLVNDKIYIKGATGGYQELPASLVSAIYDPAALLSADRGISKVLSSVQNPKTEGTETLDGVATVKVSGRVGKDVVTSIVPGIKTDVDAVFWIREDNKQPVKAQIKIPADGKTATADITLRDVNKPVTIEAPK
jgi:lipoprotein LprG